jgi:hypothetical protein
VHQIFVLLTCCTSFDVFYDPAPGARPEVFSVDASNCFISSGVTIDGAFMPYVHQFTFQSLIQRYNELSTFDVPSEWFVQIVYTFNWIDSCPFFHQSAVVVLNGCDHVFNRSI